MQAGDVIPVTYTASNYDDSQFPRATITDAEGNEIATSPVNLVAVGTKGFYRSLEAIFPAEQPWVDVFVEVFSDSGHTVQSTSLGATDYAVYATGGGSSSTLPSIFNVVGIVDGQGCAELPIQDVIVQNSDRTITVRLVEGVETGEPFDLTGNTLIEFRFRNTDGTVLSITSDDEGAPVQVVSARAGKLLCVLTAEQTAALLAQAPSPFVIIVTKVEGVTVVNLPTQLAVEEQDI